MRTTAALAGLAALASTVAATGSANIYNNCAYDVYLWPVDILRPAGQPQIIKSGASYSEVYHTPPTGGVSLKLAKSAAGYINPTQFEYTLAGGFLWYDGSDVNCAGSQCPFYNDGIYLDASDPSCPTRTCQPGTPCTGFYLTWNDDINTLSCNPSASVSMYLCSTSATTSVSSGSGSGSSSAAAAAAAPASAAAAAAAPASSAASSSQSYGVAAAAAPASPASSPECASSSTPASSPAPKYQMEALGGPGVPKSRVRRHLHNHMRRHSHQ